MDRLEGFTTLTSASHVVGVSTQTLKQWADKGLIRVVRDDAGRRLLLREDVERIARERAARSQQLHRRAGAK